METHSTTAPQFKAKKILLITSDFVEDSEVMVPYQLLTMVGHTVRTVCPKRKAGAIVKTAIHDREDDQTFTEKPGHNFKLNFDFDNVKEEDYDGLLLPGGRCPEYLRLNERVMQIVRYFLEKNRPIAAVCHGIQLLTAAGGIQGRTITCTWGVYTEVEMAGAILKKVAPTEAVVDGNIVTAPGKWAHPEWLAKFLEVIGTKFVAKKSN